MLRITLKTVLAARRRLLGTALAVFLGVAFLSGTLALSDTLRANFDELFADASAGTDVVVRSATEISVAGDRGPDTRQRGLVDASLVERLWGVEGVEVAEASIEGYGQLLGSDGKAVGGNGPPRVAGTWITDPELNPYRLVEGRPPRAPGEVVVNRGAAEEGRLSVGARTVVQTPEPVEVTVVGIATFGDADGMGQVTFAGFTAADAARHITRDPTRASSVLVRGADGVSQDELARRVRAVLPPGVEAITGAQLTEENLDDISAQFLDMLSAFLVVFAGVALLVASFSIYNTFSILVAQRSRDVALLRAAGATRRQVLVSALAETAVVGVVASVAGLAGGVALAGLLKGLFDTFGFSLPAGGLVFGPSSVVVSLVVGVVATLAAGAAPAVRASGVAPLAALRDVAVDSSGSSRARAVVGAVLMGAGVAAVLGAVGGGSGGSTGLAGLGAAATMVGVVVLGPVVARPAASLLGWPASRLGGATGSLSRQNAVRNPRRTAGSATALLVGVGVVVLFTVFASSLKASIDRSVTESFGGDLVVATPSFGGGTLSPQLAESLRRLPEVERATGVGEGPATVDGVPRRLTVADPALLGELLDLDVVDGALAAVGPAEVAVSDEAAADRGWRVGSPVAVTFADGGGARLTVAAVYRAREVAGDYLVSRVTWGPHAPQDSDRMVLVSLAEGVALAEGRAAVERAVEPYGRPPVQDREEYAASAAQGVDMLLGIVYALLGLAVLIALMGIANTLSLSVHERTRELGLLRAVGQTRRQVRSMVLGESVVVAVFGTLGGTALGLFLGWALVRAAGAETALFTVPTGRLAVVVAAGAVAGVLAGVRPARRAARLDVLRAIATA
ncbi:MAG TPA: ABC transporter permease [Acidimicrobiales bacterium]|nr:ABC transporter permease [Acidimicrobiales bacterium]